MKEVYCRKSEIMVALIAFSLGREADEVVEVKEETFCIVNERNAPFELGRHDSTLLQYKMV